MDSSKDLKDFFNKVLNIQFNKTSSHKNMNSYLKKNFSFEYMIDNEKNQELSDDLIKFSIRYPFIKIDKISSNQVETWKNLYNVNEPILFSLHLTKDHLQNFFYSKDKLTTYISFNYRGEYLTIPIEKIEKEDNLNGNR